MGIKKNIKKRIKKLAKEIAPVDPARSVSDSAGVLWGTYNSEYAEYETSFPASFPWPRAEMEDKPRYIKGSDGYWYNPNAAESGKAVLSCTGDLMCEPKQHRAYKYGDHYYFHPQFKFVRGIFRNSDFAVGNLETTLSDNAPYADQLHVLKTGGYHCNAPVSYLDAIRYAGFDALVNANNHNCDSAVTGLMDTLDALDAKGFMHTGTFHPRGDKRALYVKVNGIKLAILSYATYFNKIETNFTKLGRDTLLNTYTKEKAEADIAAAKKNGAEFVLVYIHWGIEYTHEVSDMQKRRAQELADAGADYIVGSHPHALQPYSTVAASDGRRVPVIYSMGNFVTNESKRISKHCGILQIVLQKTTAGAEIKGEYFIPCYVFNQLNGNKYAPVPTDIALSDGGWYETQPESEKYIQSVMGDISAVVTATVTTEELCRVLGVKKPDGIKNRPFSSLCADVKYVVENSAYFDIKHSSEVELKKILRKGPAVIVTEHAVEGTPCIEVENVSEAYEKMLAEIRCRFSTKTVAVAGRAGKTTTREVLAGVLCNHNVVLASSSSSDSRYTGMLLMQRLRSYHEVYLQEVCEDDPHCMQMLSHVIRPDHAIIMCSTVSEKTKTGEEPKRTFTEIAEGMPPEGVLYVNGDDTLLMESIHSDAVSKRRVKTFGFTDNLDYRIENLRSDGRRLRFDIAYDGKTAHMEFSSPMKVDVYSAAAAFAVAVEMGISGKDAAKSIAECKSSSFGVSVTNYSGLTLLLDGRSATPASVRSAVCSLCALNPGRNGNRIAVIGDMDVDGGSEEEHRGIGEFLAETGVDRILCCGAEAKHVYDAALDKGFNKKKVVFCETTRQLEQKLSSLLKPGDILMIRGGSEVNLNSVRKLFRLDCSVD